MYKHICKNYVGKTWISNISHFWCFFSLHVVLAVLFHVERGFGKFAVLDFLLWFSLLVLLFQFCGMGLLYYSEIWLQLVISCKGRTDIKMMDTTECGWQQTTEAEDCRSNEHPWNTDALSINNSLRRLTVFRDTVHFRALKRQERFPSEHIFYVRCILLSNIGNLHFTLALIFYAWGYWILNLPQFAGTNS